MKKLFTLAILAIATLSFTSCEKEELPINYKKAAFGGMLSSKGKVTINGKPAVLNQVYEVKKGDVLKFTDPGDDIVTPGWTLYSTTGGPNIVHPSTTEHGVTYGEIIIETGSVANSYGQVDVNLTYTVK
jgi:hypothetical protein